MPSARGHTLRSLFALLCLALVGIASGCLPPPTPRSLQGSANPGGPVDYAARIDSQASWVALAAKPGTEHVARSEVVKVIWDKSDDKVYFLESRRWPIHFFFANRFLDRPGNRIPEQTSFNVIQYKTAERRFVLGTITRYLDADRWAYDLFAGDTLSLEGTAEAFRRVKERVFFGDKLAYRPVPPAHEQNIARAKELMPIVTTDEIFGAIRYQPLELGEAFGYLRIYRKGVPFDPHALRPYDVVVFAEQPEDIPVVSGVVTDRLQAPLGHINVLCHNRKTPNMALRDASTAPEIVALEGKLVRIAIATQGFAIEPTTQVLAEASWATKRPAKGFRPERDDRDVGMPSLRDLGREDVAIVGAKTAQLAFAGKSLPAGTVPRAFALPFAAYARFLKGNGLDRALEGILADAAFQRDPAVRVAKLDAFRAAMTRAPVPEDIVSALIARIAQVLPPGKVRLRSSTNAEDLPGFNGAGLYRSTRVDPSKRDDVVRGLREVWASTWLVAAFEEREYYRIDHRTVGMSILVQESIDDDTGNGVAVTANPFSQGNPGYFINAQVSGASVTGAKGGEVPEQILYYTYDTGRGFERLSRSSLAKGGVVLDDPAVEELRARLAVLQTTFTGDSLGATGRAVDVEFLVRKTAPRIIIVQARPFTVVWPDDRRWRDERGGFVDPDP